MSGRPFQKGVSGNPGGVPRGLRRAYAVVKETISGILNEPSKFEPDTTRLKRAIRVIAEKFEQGDIKAGEFLFDRLLGKPVQELALAGPWNELLDRMSTEELEAFALSGDLPAWALEEMGIERGPENNTEPIN